MKVRVEHGIDDLARDLLKIARQAPKDMRAVVREGGRVGNTVAKDYARVSAGKHGKHYPKSFTVDVKSFYGFGGGTHTAEYGPDASKPQGGMSFENGSRNQPAHNDLAKSADLIAPSFAQEVRRLPDRWFW